LIHCLAVCSKWAK